MKKLFFFLILFFVFFGLSTHLAILPPKSPTERLEEKFAKIKKEDKSSKLANIADKGVFQKRHLELNSVHRQ